MKIMQRGGERRAEGGERTIDFSISKCFSPFHKSDQNIWVENILKKFYHLKIESSKSESGSRICFASFDLNLLFG